MVLRIAASRVALLGARIRRRAASRAISSRLIALVVCMKAYQKKSRILRAQGQRSLTGCPPGSARYATPFRSATVILLCYVVWGRLKPHATRLSQTWDSALMGGLRGRRIKDFHWSARQ